MEQDCPGCGRPGELRTVVTTIPHFKDVAIMAFTCEKCGYRTNEVHATGPFTGHGTRSILHVKEPLDMTRSLLKSETCTLRIPELELELGAGTLGSRFTTVEGIVDAIAEELAANPFIVGDSAESAQQQRFKKLVEGLHKIRDGTVPFTIDMDDPMSNSHIQNPLAPEPDPQLTVQEYPLTWKQKEELGITDMRTERDNLTGMYLAPAEPK